MCNNLLFAISLKLFEINKFLYFYKYTIHDDNYIKNALDTQITSIS